jgi:hypothetical protein
LPKLTRYSRLIRDFNLEVDSYIKRRYGNRPCHRIRSGIHMALATTLFTAKAYRRNVPKGRLCKAIVALEKALVADGYRLPRAWFEARMFGTSRKTVMNRWEVKGQDLDALEKLWSDLGFSTSEYKKLIKTSRARWRFAVDELHESVTIRLSDHAIADMLLLALEAYAVPKGKGTRFTEAYGICAGSTRSTEEKRRGHGKHKSRFVQVMSVRTQVRAEGFPDRVDYDLRSIEAQMALMDHFMLGSDIVADFHTHPYENEKELLRLKGWEYSEADEATMIPWVRQLWDKNFHPRASLIMSMTEGKRKMKAPGQTKPNLVRFSIGKYRFYLAAYRICGDHYSERDISLNADALPGI